eukprot:CAMPEP_0185518940 /NCGR_PEP_ID=MMETSP1366-20130426/73157_1 /TAXON_ID=38817 /ORGANISM="Gephyrocapsa oceanica, Strain RCC1303" /LENGTH=58 /DNA_ID=CAMNT_0028129987 /DNA_START=153 /DNA_END=326 /DNA_ORIENTATION=+
MSQDTSPPPAPPPPRKKKKGVEGRRDSLPARSEREARRRTTLLSRDASTLGFAQRRAH